MHICILRNDRFIDLLSKAINSLKVPTLILFVNFFYFDSNSVSISISQLFLVTSILSFGYLDYISRLISFKFYYIDRIRFLISVYRFFVLVFLFSIIVVFFLKISGIINFINDVSYFVIIASVFLFFKVSHYNILRVLGDFKSLLKISLIDILILFLTFLFALTVDINVLFFFIISGITSLHFHCKFFLRSKKISIKYIGDLPKGFVNFIYIVFYWFVSVYLKTYIDNHSYFIYIDIFYFLIFPITSIFISFAHIKNNIKKYYSVHRLLIMFTLFFLVFFDVDFALLIIILMLILVLTVELYGVRYSLLIIVSLFVALIEFRSLYISFFILIFSLLYDFRKKNAIY